MRRCTVPLYKTRHAKFVEAAIEFDNPDKSVPSHLAIGTGARNDTICHTHADWFFYGENGGLYYKIPHSDDCRKDNTEDACGECDQYKNGYFPKTPAGEGREILISNYWTHPVSKEREYFGLRDAIENYFALDGPKAPDSLQHGRKMFKGYGPGISTATLGDYVREIAVEAGISARLREERIRKEITIDDDGDREQKQLNDYGTDSDGNQIPDIFPHDLRATFCTQLMRNDVSRSKAIILTGHSIPKSMNPYVDFANGEIDRDEQDRFY